MPAGVGLHQRQGGCVQVVTRLRFIQSPAVRRWFDADPPVALRPLVATALSELASALTAAAQRIQAG
jgi:hypothetical protein